MDNIKPKKNKKKIVVIVIIILVIIALIAAGIFAYYRSKAAVLPGDDMDYTYYEGTATNYYAGVVEAQETWNISKDMERTVGEVFVEVGDQVHVGDVLFVYSTDDTATQIESAKIEIEGYQNTISDYNNQIDVINRQLERTYDEDARLEYSAQISQIRVQIRQTELSIKTKQIELNKLQARMDSALVYSKIDGIVKSINGMDYYMTILGTGDFRVKAKIDEMHIYEVQEGQRVYVHSRVNDDVWTGTVSEVETNEDKNNNNNDYGMDQGNGATKYSFYVTLDDAKGLLMGQHVYIELEQMDFGGDYTDDIPMDDIPADDMISEEE